MKQGVKFYVTSLTSVRFKMFFHVLESLCSDDNWTIDNNKATLYKTNELNMALFFVFLHLFIEQSEQNHVLKSSNDYD